MANRWYKKWMLILMVVLLSYGGVKGQVLQNAGQAGERVEKPLIQMAILLDASGSMSGLISQAKSQLWKVVNEFATAKQNGVAPEVQVALYEYGKSTLPAAENFLRMIVPLTTDLDKVSAELFALETSGGSEFCGTVIKESLSGLEWSDKPSDYKVIFIAGNEPFTQGEVDYRESCKAAIAKGIIVNTIHCGDHQVGINTMWKDGADLAEGSYMSIDQNQQVVHVAAPQDKLIAELGEKLNETYVAYGKAGGVGKQQQAAQDKNAKGVKSGAAVQRAITKATMNYRNALWDLVDAIKEQKVDLAKMKKGDLPKEMQAMALAEQKAYLADKAQARGVIQKQIMELDAARKNFVADEMRKQGLKAENTLDGAIIKAVREQASRKNIKLEAVLDVKQLEGLTLVATVDMRDVDKWRSLGIQSGFGDNEPICDFIARKAYVEKHGTVIEKGERFEIGSVEVVNSTDTYGNSGTKLIVRSAAPQEGLEFYGYGFSRTEKSFWAIDKEVLERALKGYFTIE